jgi:hypothetical protein
MNVIVFLSATVLTAYFIYQFVCKFRAKYPHSPRQAKHRHPQNIRSKRKGRHKAEVITTGEILGNFKESLPDMTRKALISNEGRPTH